MRRILLNFLQKQSANLIRNEETAEEETVVNPVRTKEQIEALNDLYSTYVHPVKCSYQSTPKKTVDKRNLISVLKLREMGLINLHRYTNARHNLMDRLLPNKGEVVASMIRPTFCGQFSEDGQRFYSACQDCFIRLYDTSSSDKFQRLAEIAAEDVGWSILDTALSPDRNTIAYSTWSDCMYLIKLNTDEDQPTIIPLALQPHTHSFSIFSLQYSVDGSELIGGSNDACVYVYDLVKQRRTLRVEAHVDDINAVRYIDNSNSLIASGSDDNLLSVWDRRALNESNPKPVGIFAGHSNGITFIHSRMDTRYLISNSKDQSIKLWDLRRFASESTIEKSRKILNHLNHDWDYRYDSYGRRPKRFDIPGDPSVRTYDGHSVNYTLIRCYFSPAFSTGQKYIITGSSDGLVHIYDVLTGDIKLRLRTNGRSDDSRERCVRDVSWHPYENYIITTAWTNTRAHMRWTYSFDESLDSKSTSSTELNTISLNLPDSPPPVHRIPRQLLFQQLYGYVPNMNDDDDDDDEEEEEEEDLS